MQWAWAAWRGPVTTDVIPLNVPACSSAKFTFDNVVTPATGAAVGIAKGYGGLLWGNWGAVNAVAAAAAQAKLVVAGGGPISEAQVSSHRSYATGYAAAVYKQNRGHPIFYILYHYRKPRSLCIAITPRIT